MIETTDPDKIQKLRDENPDEVIRLKPEGSSWHLLFHPGRDVPMRVPAEPRKARYTDDKKRSY